MYSDLLSMQKKEQRMRQYSRVICFNAEWTFIEEIRGKYLLRSLNKNLGDVLVHPSKVRMIHKSAEKLTINKIKQGNEDGK